MLLAFFASVSLVAQDRTIVEGKIKKDAVKETENPNGWKKGGEGILNFSITNFNNNWQGGNQDAIAINANLGTFANFRKNKFTWNNNLRLGFGVIKLDSLDFRKADDLILFESTAGYAFTEKVFGVGFLDFTTQFANGYDYTAADAPLVSKLLSPAVLRLGLGVDYRPTDYFNVVFAPVTFRGLIINDQEIANLFKYGNKANLSAANDTLSGKKFTPELGALLKVNFKKDLMKNVNFQSEFIAFGDYLNGFKSYDLRWINRLNLKINKYLGTTIESNMLYDSRVDVRTAEAGKQTGLQHRLFLGVGFNYKF